MRRLIGVVVLVLAACGDDDGSPVTADAAGTQDGPAVDAAGPDAEIADAAPPDASLCGNGAMDPGEVCDDSNTMGGDGCRADCLGMEVCGDGFVDVGEYCLPDAPATVSAPMPGLNQGIGFADVDGDGDIDAAAYYGTTLHLELNDGSGQLGAPIDTGLDLFVGQFADMTGDTKPDLVTLNGGMTRIFAGDGLGGFTLAGEAALNGATAIGDLDGDGDRDLVVVTFGDDTGHVLKNDGTGMLAETDTFPAGDEPRFVALGRLDADDKLDVAVAGDTNAGNMQIGLNAGDGSFGTPATLTIVFPGGAHIADLDRDGDLDVIAGGSLLPGKVNLLFNDGAGVFTATTVLTTMSSIAPGVTAADLDFDGAADLTGFGSAPSAAFVMRNDGAGAFSDFKPYTGTPVDLNGDGALDLLQIAYDGALDQTTVTGRISDP